MVVLVDEIGKISGQLLIILLSILFFDEFKDGCVHCCIDLAVLLLGELILVLEDSIE